MTTANESNDDSSRQGARAHPAEREPGELATHAAPALPTRQQPDDDRLRDRRRAKTVSIYGEEAVRITDFVRAYPNLETGGDLFGFWTNSGAPVVSYVIGPGKESEHHHASFYQDAEWLREAGTGLYDRHGLQHIGEWHSHHRLGLKKPSRGDIRTVVRGMAAKNWSKFVLMIATLDESEQGRVAQNYYLVNPNGDYKPLRPRALPGGSPFRTASNDPREETFQGRAANPEAAMPEHSGGSHVRPANGSNRRDPTPESEAPESRAPTPALARLPQREPPQRGSSAEELLIDVLHTLRRVGKKAWEMWTGAVVSSQSTATRQSRRNLANHPNN